MWQRHNFRNPAVIFMKKSLILIFLISLRTRENFVKGLLWPLTCPQESWLQVCSNRGAFNSQPSYFLESSDQEPKCVSHFKDIHDSFCAFIKMLQF